MMERMEGKWYAVFMYPDLSKKIPKCKSINISLDDNNQYSMIIKSIDHRYVINQRTQDRFIAKVFFNHPNSFGTVKMLNQKILKVEPQNGKYVLGTRNKGDEHEVQPGNFF